MLTAEQPWQRVMQVKCLAALLLTMATFLINETNGHQGGVMSRQTVLKLEDTGRSPRVCRHPSAGVSLNNMLTPSQLQGH